MSDRKCNSFVEDIFNEAREAGHTLPLDMTEPRLQPLLNQDGPEDVMAAGFSHLPAWLRHGV